MTSYTAGLQEPRIYSGVLIKAEEGAADPSTSIFPHTLDMDHSSQDESDELYQDAFKHNGAAEDDEAFYSEDVEVEESQRLEDALASEDLTTSHNSCTSRGTAPKLSLQAPTL